MQVDGESLNDRPQTCHSDHSKASGRFLILTCVRLGQLVAFSEKEP